VDVGLFLRVLWRFRALLVGGLLLATALAVLAFARVELGGGRPALVYRDAETWQAVSRLLVSPGGFPFRALPAQAPDTQSVDPTTFALLASKLAEGDAVRELILEDGPILGKIHAFPVQDSSSHYLPFIDIAATAPTPAGARAMAVRAAEALQRYVDREQARRRVPAGSRFALEAVIEPRTAMLVEPRSKTLPALVFLAVFALAVALALVLENVRPKTRVTPELVPELEPAPRARRRA
jgi:hypothetical protein